MPKKGHSIRRALLSQIESGKREFVLPNAQYRQAFYWAAQWSSKACTTMRDPESSAYLGFVQGELEKKDPAKEVWFQPALWSSQIIFDKAGNPLPKFLKGNEEDKRFPCDWYFISREHFTMVQPRYSESPVACLANLALPIGAMTVDNTMLACAKNGAFLGWPLTLARSLFSIPTGSAKIIDEVVDLAYSHLTVFEPEFDETDFRKIVKKEYEHLEKN